jgi:hypothetical protein
MGPVQRFTRDAASKYVWASLMAAGILGLVFTITKGSDAVEAERLASEGRAVAAVDQVVRPRLDASDLEAPIAAQELTNLREAIDRTILGDPRVVRLQIWSEDGRLWFSTDRDEHLGSEAALNDEILQQAVDGQTITRSNLTDTGGLDERGRSLLRTYAPLGSNAVVEVDQTSEGTIAPVRSAWRRYQILAGALVALFLLLTILSLRDPIERINTGVAFASSSIPAGYSLIGDERLHAVEEVYRLAHDRVARLEEKLAQSEEMRRRLEGDIQRARTQAATGAATRPADTPTPTSAPAVERPPAAGAPATPPAAVTPRPSKNGDATPVMDRPPRPAEEQPVEREVVSLPDSDVVGETRDTARGGPLARAIREDTSQPELRPKVEPSKEKRAPRLRRKRAPEQGEPVAPVVIPPAEPERPSRASRLARKPDPVAAESPPATPSPEIDDARAHEAALETFIRLTESDRQHAESAEVDQGAVRAALARTAARKKPGGLRLQPHEGEQGESPGGPPRRGSS